ncbi:MAG: hypothetical protein ACI4VB_04095 [Bradymonadia bacterium]
MDTRDKTQTSEKETYETPKIEYLGVLSALIQGSSGSVRDAFPQPGTRA